MNAKSKRVGVVYFRYSVGANCMAATRLECLKHKGREWTATEAKAMTDSPPPQPPNYEGCGCTIRPLGQCGLCLRDGAELMEAAVPVVDLAASKEAALIERSFCSDCVLLLYQFMVGLAQNGVIDHLSEQQTRGKIVQPGKGIIIPS